MRVGNGHPLVSVIIPTYNRGRFLREAVDSVVRQTMPAWELIVVDDGSTDDSPAQIDALHDARIRVVGIAHSGSPAHARNVGIGLARGEWIAFLDSDDVWLPEKLELQLGRLPSHPSARWSCTGFNFIDGNSAPLSRASASAYEPRSGWILEALIAFHATASIQTLVVHRSLITGSEWFDGSLVPREDYDLALRLADKAELCALAERLTLIREHPERTTHGIPVADLHAIGSRVFRKAAAAATSSRIRRLCYRQCATQLVARARVLSSDGRHRDAMSSALRATLDAPQFPLVWRAAAGCTYRAVAGAIRH
jgi:glycosyltransferase involved in cell wall biosynthesis